MVLGRPRPGSETSASIYNGCLKKVTWSGLPRWVASRSLPREWCIGDPCLKEPWRAYFDEVTWRTLPQGRKRKQVC
jgi:hypothetical protein